jgi:hypothetical protein
MAAIIDAKPGSRIMIKSEQEKYRARRCSPVSCQRSMIPLTTPSVMNVAYRRVPSGSVTIASA